MERFITDHFHPLLLRYGAWEAAVSPEHGMNTLSLSFQGKEILRIPESAEAYAALPEAFGLPPIMPANRTRNGVFSFEGREYRLPINDRFGCHKHGFLPVTAFSVREQTADSVTGVYENQGGIYPFPFRAEMTYRLGEDGYTQEFRFVNTGERTMPVIFAIHAAFKMPATAAVPVSGVWEADEQCIPVGTPVEPAGAILRYLDGRTVLTDSEEPVGVCCPSGGHTAAIGDLCYEVSENFTQWILWNGNGDQGFLCAEPQSAPSDALNHKKDLITVLPGQSVLFRTRIFPRGGAL